MDSKAFSVVFWFGVLFEFFNMFTSWAGLFASTEGNKLTLIPDP